MADRSQSTSDAANDDDASDASPKGRRSSYVSLMSTGIAGVCAALQRSLTAELTALMTAIGV